MFCHVVRLTPFFRNVTIEYTTYPAATLTLLLLEIPCVIFVAIMKSTIILMTSYHLRIGCANRDK